MAKPLKIVLVILGTLLLVVVGLAIAVPLVFDPNDHRDRIRQAVKDATGRDFDFARIELRVFPWIRVSIADTRLGNAPGFSDQPLARAGELSVGVRVVPLLFDREIIVSRLTVDGLALNLERDAQGVGNWEGIGGKDKPAAPPPTEDEVKFDPESIDIAGITVKNAALTYADAREKKNYAVSNLALDIGAFRPGKPFDVSLAAALSSTAPMASADVELKAHVVPALEAKRVEVQDLELKVKGKGFDVDTEAQLTGKLFADNAKQVYRVEGLKIAADFAGGPITGGKQTLTLTSDVMLDRDKGLLTLGKTALDFAGLHVDTEIRGEGFFSAGAGKDQKPRLSGPLRIASFSPRELLGKLGRRVESADPNVLKQASLTAQYSGTFESATLEKVNLTLDQTNAQGMIAVRDFATSALEFALKVDDIDVDRYMAPKTAPAADAPPQEEKDVNQVELPTEALKNLNANGTLDIGKLKLNGLSMTDVRVRISGPKGATKQQQISAKLYGGTLVTRTSLEPSATPQWHLATELDALNAAPFLKDLVGKDKVSGLGNLKLDLDGRGGTVGELRKTLNGAISFRVENGAVKGFNLGQLLRQAQAALQGNLNYTEEAPKETDFTALTFSGQIVNGVLRSDQLSGASPAFRIAGSGEIDLVNETINYLAKPVVVDTSKGQGGKGLEDLKGIVIPIRLSGSLFDPKYKVDLEEALKQKATEKLHKEYEKVEDKAKEKLRDKLGELLFGKPKQQQQEQQQQQQQPAPAPAPEPPKQ